MGEAGESSGGAATRLQAHGGRPPLLFAFGEELEVSALFAPDDLRRLGAVARIADPAPLRRFDDGRAAGLLADAEILVTGWGSPPLGEDVLAQAPRLKLVAHAAGSVKFLVGPALFARGIRVVSAADANARPVAEFTLAAILFANKRVFDFRRLYANERRGLRLNLEAPRAVGNWQKTVGLVGASRVGRQLIELLRPFDFRLVVCDPFLSEAGAKTLGVDLLPLEALLRASDVVSLHAPSLHATRHMIGRSQLAAMADGAVLINTARGALVDQEALLAELVSGRLSAVLDVTEPEALPADSPLYDLPNLLLTPHIAGALGDERHRFGRLVADEVVRFVKGDPLRHEINPATLDTQA